MTVLPVFQHDRERFEEALRLKRVGHSLLLEYFAARHQLSIEQQNATVMGNPLHAPNAV